MRGQELLTFVVYDIVDDGVRGRIANVCKDYGLERIQYSALCGALDATRRSELAARLADTLGRNVGKIMMLPVCEKDARARRDLVNEPTAEPAAHA